MNSKDPKTERSDPEPEDRTTPHPQESNDTPSRPENEKTGEPAGSPGNEPDGEDSLLNIPDFILNAIEVDEEGRTASVAPGEYEAPEGYGAGTEEPPAEGGEAGAGVESAAAPGSVSETTELPVPAGADGSAAPPREAIPAAGADAGGGESLPSMPVETSQSPEAPPAVGEGAAPSPAVAEKGREGEAPSPDVVEKRSEGQGGGGGGGGFTVEEGTSVFQFVREVAMLCFSRLGDWDLVKEATAETMIHVLRVEGWGAGVPEEERRGRVLELARQVSLDLLRREALLSAISATASPTPSHTDSVAQPQMPPSREPHEFHDDPNLEGARAREVVEELPEPQRSLFRMRMWNAVSFKEMGQWLGKTDHSMASLFRATLKHLEKRLQELDPPLQASHSIPNEEYSTPPASGPGDEKLIGPDGVELEKKLALLFPNPEGQPKQRLLVSVARRVLAATSIIDATVRHVSGSVDFLPSHQRLHNLARLKGKCPVVSRDGLRVFGGEVFVTGEDTTAVLGLRSGHELVVAPGSIIVVGTPQAEETGMASGAILQGRLFVLPGSQVTATLSVTFPGGAVQSFYDTVQIVVLSLASTRVETLDGTPVVTNKLTKRNPGRLEAVLCRGGTNPAIGPSRRESGSFAWVESHLRSPGFPEDTRDRFEAVVHSIAGPPGRARTPVALNASKKKSEKSEAQRKQRQLVIVAAVVVVVAVAAVFYFLHKRSAVPAGPADWFAEASVARRSELGLPARAGGASPPLFRTAAPNGRIVAFSFARLVYSGGPEGMMMPQYYSQADFKQARSQAWTAIQSESDWPATAEALVKSFCEHLKNRNSQGLGLLVPGIADGLWETVIGMMGTVSDYTIKPMPVEASAGGLKTFRVTLKFQQGGQVRYQVVVMSGQETGGRPWIDVLSSRWDLLGSEGAPDSLGPGGTKGGPGGAGGPI